MPEHIALPAERRPKVLSPLSVAGASGIGAVAPMGHECGWRGGMAAVLGRLVVVRVRCIDLQHELREAGSKRTFESTISARMQVDSTSTALPRARPGYERRLGTLRDSQQRGQRWRRRMNSLPARSEAGPIADE
jgi:hypothetical protein